MVSGLRSPRSVYETSELHVRLLEAPLVCVLVYIDWILKTIIAYQYVEVPEYMA